MTIFYVKNIIDGENQLSEEESKHCAQVLRHQKGDEILVFDGNGGIYRSILTQVSKKSCSFNIISSELQAKKPFQIHLAIAPTKNADRMEWLVEKLSEIGIDEITFIETAHSERRKLRLDRLEKKAISAMKQSGNPFLLKINELASFTEVLDSHADIKLIAHVDDSHAYILDSIESHKSVLILIGPEGDFSLDELGQAKSKGFKAISLGNNTLRTETAGFVACCLANSVNRY